MKRKVKDAAAEVVKKATSKSRKEAGDVTKSPVKAVKKAKVVAPAFIERTAIQPQEYTLQPGESVCNVVCWNVAGLRGTLKNNKGIFDEIVQRHHPHIICLQETKIQAAHEAELDADEALLPGYCKFWASSMQKKGYSGTALFIQRTLCSELSISSGTDSGEGSNPPPKGQKSIASFFGTAKATKSSKKKASPAKKAPSPPSSLPLSLQAVTRELPDTRFAGEGRTITAEFDKFFLVNCYVPNSGQTLDRLDYRTQEWDPYLYKHLKELEARKPVIFTGDLNVAHLDLDIHNPEAKHLVKMAGVTPQERESFSSLLATGFQDALRFFYPEHAGQFTYWSQRTNARPVNKGLRLDYFLCSRSLFPSPHPDPDEADQQRADDAVRVLDSSVLFEGTEGCSDHCPVLLSLAVR